MSRVGDVSVAWLCRVARAGLEVRRHGASGPGRRRRGEDVDEGEAPAGAAVESRRALDRGRGARALRASLLPAAQGVPRCAPGARAEADAGAAAESRTGTPCAQARRVDLP